MNVTGIVQGVGFRYKVRHIARRMSLKGQVENLSDETVRIICEGDTSDIDRFVEAVRGLKTPVEIDDIKIEYSEPQGLYKKFSIITGDLLTEMTEGFGTGSIYLDILINKQDQMLGKQDQMLGKQDQMLGKQDQMPEHLILFSEHLILFSEHLILFSEHLILFFGKQDITNNEIRSLASDRRNTMDVRFQRLEEEIAQIKMKIC